MFGHVNARDNTAFGWLEAHTHPCKRSHTYFPRNIPCISLVFYLSKDMFAFFADDCDISSRNGVYMS